MKKIIAVLGAMTLLFGCAKQLTDNAAVQVPSDGTVSFVAGFEKSSDPTRVSTAAGVSTWDAGDAISIFSVETGAAAGVSVGTNVQYETATAGSSATFTPAADGIAASDKYYAFFPYQPTYASKLNAAAGIDFAGATAGSQLTDYRFIPINVNSGATFVVDPATGNAVSTNSNPFFYASADAPADPADPVSFTFKPILPILEFDLYGYGTVRQIEVAFTDKATDAYAEGNWLTAKGVFDVSTGTMTTTNYSSSAYYKLVVTLKESDLKPYVDLLGDTPVKMNLTVGHFSITKGLTLTFTDKDGNSFSKSIWGSETVSSKTAGGVSKHIRQGINVPYVKASTSSVAEFPAAGGESDAFTITTNSSWSIKSKPDWITLSSAGGTGGESVTATAAANGGAARNGAIVLKTAEGSVFSIEVSQAEYVVLAADWYSVDLGAIDFSESYIYNVRNASDELIGWVTKEFLGATVNKQAVVVYPAPSATPDYTAGLVAQVTKAAGSDPAGNIHGGTVNSNSMTPGDISYVEGSSAALTTVWIKADGSAVATSAPSGSVSTGGVSAYVLTSPSDISHKLAKVGTMIWTAEGYKTTKLGNGDSMNVIGATGATSSSATVAIDGDKYLYNSYAVSAGLAPAGWDLPSPSQWKTTLAGFLGGTATYDNLGANGAMLYDRTCFKKPNANAPTDLSYYNTWSNAANGTKWDMLLCQSTKAPGSSAQALTAMFEVRLVKE